MDMDIEFLKKIDFPLRVTKIKPDQFFSDKKKKSKPQEKEEKKKNKIDVRVENPWKIQKKFNLEVLEINDIAEKLFVRLDHKIKTLKTVEDRADQKIAILDGLITKFKTMNFSTESLGDSGDGRPKEVNALAGKGFKPNQIARILDLPSGEVELILNLDHKGEYKNFPG